MKHGYQPTEVGAPQGPPPDAGTGAVTPAQPDLKVRVMLTPEQTERLFVQMFQKVANDIHATNVANGWWLKDRNNYELIALCHSELSEAVEALRHGNPPDDKVPEFTGVEAELADTIIRIMDLAYARHWRVGEAIIAKLAVNKTRGYRHVGKEA